jgi:hypothetical protein
MVRRGSTSGTVFVSCSKVAAAGTYEYFVCDGDPTVADAWRSVGQFSTCRSIELSGLQPAKQTYIKVRCHGTGAPGPFSEYVGLIVL